MARLAERHHNLASQRAGAARDEDLHVILIIAETGFPANR
jgi:hypothetical protein